ncbi:PepSY-associated TM helix domain-containing protein [Adhaeribacter pallidiroseus]|uniref:Assimilatory sulfite reductase (NADPH) n=1 Tax=Adhaeribacter pallidiroseus TaxID=2072847 RepID=A0A369QQ14_9BACT|nr:PepSY-associated TM helix domain-containing protein [Adhaeribacter pallidiroseus]RDC66480.1 Assimilatory sulfite reductase (NADPH) [Adhaeribacter pallidiroseus]
MKNFFRSIHLYLSLACGLVIGLVCFTGATMVFEKEMMQAIYPDRYQVTPGTQRLPLEQLLTNFNQAKPGIKVAGVKVYSDPTRTVELSYSDEKPAGKDGDKGEHKGSENREHKAEEKGGAAGADKGEKGGHGGPGKGGKGGGGRPGNVAFINPYTGQLIATSTQKNAFFRNMFELHRWLLVQEPGKLIVGVSTVVFLFILITGIILWWPKNKKILQQRLTVKWNAGWKRINHDWHIVIGFYTALFLFVFAFTGLAWSFEWFNDGIYTLTNTTKDQPEPPVSQVKEGAKPITFDQAFATAQQQIPNAEFYQFNRPREAEDAFMVMVMPANAAHERATSQLFIDQYSGNQLGQIAFADKNLGQRIRSTFYPVHVGSIGGLPGRIIAFISCLAGFTFPITGVIMWINRLRKNKKKSQKRAFAQAR